METNMNESVTPPQYVYLEHGDKEALCPIMITEGAFEGFVYQYGVVKVEEIGEDESAKLSFDYQLIEVPFDYEVGDEEEEKVQFETVIGDILADIIANTPVDYGHDVNDDRETDTQ